MTTATPGPVRPSERLEVLDVLRGFALFGILQVNFIPLSDTGGLNDLQLFYFEGKFRTIYSFLFGLGFAIQLIRAEEKQRPFVARYLWRTLLLLLIGTAHAVLIWRGDILQEYAIMALALPLVRRCRPWLLLVLAAAIFAFTIFGSRDLPGTGSNSLLWRVDHEQAAEAQLADQIRNEELTSYRAQREHAEAGSHCLLGLKAAALLNFDYLRRTDVYNFIRGNLMVMFLLGLYAGRRRLFHNLGNHPRLLWAVLGVGFTFGVTGAFYDTYSEFAKQHGFPPLPGWIPWGFTYFIGSTSFALFYICALSLLFLRWQSWRGWVAVLAPVGRMGLTNYLMQSVIMTTLLYGRGFGLESRWHNWQGILVLQVVFAVQVLYSRWWLARFQFGPVEWAWRSLTWFRLQPMRVAGNAEDPGRPPSLSPAPNSLA